MKPELIFHEDWKRGSDEAIMDTVRLRVPGGILYELYANGDRCFHAFSPRPYVLGQACDGTIDACVFALLFDYCEAEGLDPAALYAKAYPDGEADAPGKPKRIKRLAMAEGVSFPLTWDAPAFRGLITSLIEINHHRLASILEDEAAQGAA